MAAQSKGWHYDCRHQMQVQTDHPVPVGRRSYAILGASFERNSSQLVAQGGTRGLKTMIAGSSWSTNSQRQSCKAIKHTSPNSNWPSEACSYTLQEEQSVVFTKGPAFYRAESAQGRDLAVLAAALHGREKGGTPLRVLDVMAASGVRGARYLLQGGANEVWCNDYNPDPALRAALVYNLCSAAETAALHDTPAGAPATILAMAPAGTLAQTAAAPMDLALASLSGSSGGSEGSGGGSAAHKEESGEAAASSLGAPTNAAGVETADVLQKAAHWECQGEPFRPVGLLWDAWQWTFPKTSPSTNGITSNRSSSSDAAATATAMAGGVCGSVCTGHDGSGSGSSGNSNGCGSAVHANSTEDGTEVRNNESGPANLSAELENRRSSGSSSSSTDTFRLGSSSRSSGGGSSPAGDFTAAVLPQARTLRISHYDASRLLASLYLQESRFDVVDIDSFGSDTAFLTHALGTVSWRGGLLFLTSTDGFCSGGHRPTRALAAYGAYTRAIPCANEQGLRMLIGAAVREGAAQGLALQPVFSLFSYHGPVFRVMLRVRRSAEWPSHHLRFLGHCFKHGGNYAVGWRDLGSAACRVCNAAHLTPRRVEWPTGEHMILPVWCETSAEGVAEHGPPLTVAGPMWTGPLHCQADLLAMQGEAGERGWLAEGGVHRAKAPHSRKNRSLAWLIAVMLEEADPRLPPGYVLLDTLSRRVVGSLQRDALLAALRAAGYAAARCHIEPKSIRTNARVGQILDVAEAALGVKRRPLGEVDCTEKAAAAAARRAGADQC